MAQSGKRKKQTAQRMFIRGFLKSFFIVAILLGAAVVGYQATMKFLSVEQEEPEVIELTPTPEPIIVPRVEDISKNLIYCYEKEDHRISRILLEVLNCRSKQLAYVTIPLNTKLVMSDTLYRKLVVIKPEIPQIIKLSSITKYLEEKNLFEYGVLMAEDLLGTNISYYTVIPENLFTEMFEERVVPTGTSLTDLQQKEEAPSETGAADEMEIRSEPAQVFTGQYIEKMKEFDTQAKIKEYILELYPRLTSNLPLQDKINYIESYSELTAEQVIFLRLAGEERNSGFEVDSVQAAVQLQKLITD